MPINNNYIADVIQEYGDMLDLDGANPFKIRAYRQAARRIRSITRELAEMVEEGENLQQFSGIGEGIAEKIVEIVQKGKFHQLEEIKNKIPSGLLEVMSLEGLGPERVKKLYKELDIENIDDLERAINKGKIRELEGFGKKTEENIKKSIKQKEQQGNRLFYNRAEEYTQPLLEYMRKLESTNRLAVAGSYRRKKETVGDIDILATGKDSEVIMDHFVAYEDVEDIISKGDTKSSVHLRGGLQVDLRVVAEESYGAALNYFTGSQDHNIQTRHIAREKGLKLNEYGVFRESNQKSIAGETEDEVYQALGLPYIVPELRENRGEIEAARNNNLPQLIERKDLKGDLQMHSQYSDGGATIEEMAQAAQELGHEYIGITDHSQRVTIANGLDADELAKEIDEIDRINEKFDDFRIFKSVEVDILEDGSLDLPNSILKRLDLRVCCIHYKFNLPREKQMLRILRAMDNPYFNIFGHPTAREINKRPPIDVDMGKIMDAALDKGVYLELNSSPKRLDLNDIHCKMAKERGLKIVISTDAHNPSQLPNLRYGINQARRGWLESEDVLNTRSADKLLEMIKR
ncbi:MAG: DNA polymerase/3'-5' exonuclease PolX [Candidatus Marinimicrobia bacterium]|nr:DNA polymerase/3'-5' exonuclease PolX [Candidatus Neomarinimicrobiota bacterium]